MKGEERRQKILRRLTQAQAPVSAGVLAAEHGVSRQVIVQDVALLRAQGAAIVALSRGYRMEEPSALRRVYKMHHTDDEVERELDLIVDLGGVVEDVFVSHRVYGTVRAPMDIRSRRDVQDFIAEIASGKSSLLKHVTSDYHYHTVRAESRELLDLIGQRLEEAGLLAPLQDFEPVECAGCG